MLKLVVHVKLAFAMQRLKNIKKNFVMINKDGEGTIFRFWWGTQLL